MAMVLPVAGVILDRSALAAGFIGATIGIVAFVSRGQAVFSRADEEEIKRATAVGGFFGLAMSLLVICVDALAG